MFAAIQFMGLFLPFSCLNNLNINFFLCVLCHKVLLLPVLAGGKHGKLRLMLQSQLSPLCSSRQQLECNLGSFILQIL
jgi:hypothetical protein